MLELRQDLQNQWRELRSAMSYPLVMLALTGGLVFFLMSHVATVFQKMFLEFGLELPYITRGLFWFSERGQYLCLCTLIATLLLLLAARLFFPWRVWCRMMVAIPMLGNAIHAAGLAEFAKLLSLLVEQELPLPAAVRLTGQAASNGDLADAAQRIAGNLERGMDPAIAFERESLAFPAIWPATVSTGLKSGELAGLLANLSTVHLEQMQARSMLIRSIAPPLIFILIAVVICLCPAALLLPLFSLILGVSGGGGSGLIAQRAPAAIPGNSQIIITTILIVLPILLLLYIAWRILPRRQTSSAIDLERWQARLLYLGGFTLPLLFLVLLVVVGIYAALTLLPGNAMGGGPAVIISGSHLVNAVVLLLPLLSMMIARRMLFRQQSSAAPSMTEALLEMLEWRLLTLLYFGLAILAGFPLGFLFFCASMVVYLLVHARYVNTQRRLMLHQLAACAEARMPLPQAMLVASQHLSSSLQSRAVQTAKYLSQGFTLQRACQRAWLWFPAEFRLALATAEKSGQFGAILRSTLRMEEQARDSQQHLLGKMTYLWGVIGFMVLMLTFMLLKIVPVFAKMYQEFGLELPAMTLLLINASNYFVQKWFLILPPLLLGFVATMALLDPFLSRWVAFCIPPLELFWIKRHGSIVLRNLAAQVGEGRPLYESLQAVASDYPIGVIAERLRVAQAETAQGSSWLAAMLRMQFITPYDAAILAAAEQGNHLAWAMAEVAEHADRRSALRLCWFTNLLFPVCLMLLSAIVAFISVALFMPMIALTQGLSPR